MTGDIFAKAKQEVDLLNFLRGYGFRFKSYPSGARSNRCPNCGPSRDPHSTRLHVGWHEQGGYWLWFCHACGEAGDVVKAAQLLGEGSSAKEAARWLLGETEAPGPRLKSAPSPPPPSKERLEKVNRARLRLVRGLIDSISRKAGSRKRLWDYLINDRKIPEWVLREGVRRRLLCLLPDDPFTLNSTILRYFGNSLLKEADIITKKGSVKSVILSRPILSPFLSRRKVIGAQFRGLDGVQPKTITLVQSGLWWWKGQDDRSVCIVEGIVDLLSLVAMQWRGSILGLPGTGMASKAIEVLKGPLKTMQVTIALDSDDPGREACERIYWALSQNASVLDIPDGQDLNDLLKEGVTDWKSLIQDEEDRRYTVC